MKKSGFGNSNDKNRKGYARCARIREQLERKIIISVIGLIKINKGRDRKGNRFGNCNNSVEDDNSGKNFGAPPTGGAGTTLRAVPGSRGKGTGCGGNNSKRRIKVKGDLGIIIKKKKVVRIRK